MLCLKSHNFTYYIYDEYKNRTLPNGEFYFNKIQYRDKFHIKYFKKNKQWIQKYGEKVLYSNHPDFSIIKQKIPGVNCITIKHQLYELIKNKPYTLPYVIFDIKTNYIQHIKQFILLDNKLWFLKKSGVETYGGYDVFPIYANNDFVDNLQELIKTSNSNKKYKYNIFVLQKGVSDPLLLDSKKFDVRMYGLIVFNKTNLYVYFCKMGIIRKTLKKYNKNNTERDIQLTNTTFNKATLDNIQDYNILTELYSSEHIYYKYFNEMQSIYTDIIKLAIKYLNTSHEFGYQLLGMDYIINNDGKIYVLEINKYPAIYYDEDQIKYLHKGLDYKLFDDEFFSLTIEAINNCKFIEKNTKYYNFVYKS